MINKFNVRTLLCVQLLASVLSLLADDESAFREIVTRNPADVPRHFAVRVEKALTALPNDAQVRLSLGKVYDQSRGKEIEYLHTMVPVNASKQKHGVEQYWRPWHGRVLREVPFADGVQHGDEVLYDDAGRKTMVIPWQKGQVDGDKVSFHPNGAIKTKTVMVAGKAYGTAKTFDSAGKLLRESSMVDGKRHGMMREYWPETGKLKREIEYSKGRIKGVAKDFYRNGKLKRQVHFRNNRRHGVETQFEADGSPSKRRVWQDGKEITQVQ